MRRSERSTRSAAHVGRATAPPGRRAPSVAGLAIAILSCGAVAAQEPVATPQAPTLAHAAETFERAWTIVRDTYYDDTFNGVDWDAVRDELAPRAEVAETEEELRAILNDMVGRLGQSHFAIFPAEMLSDLSGDGEDGGSGGEAEIGFDIRPLGEEIVVERVDAERTGAAREVRPGWVITRVADQDVEQLRARIVENSEGHQVLSTGEMLARAVRARFNGTPGTTIETVFRDPDGETHTLALERTEFRGQTIRLGNFPPFSTEFESARIERDGLRVGVVRFNAWMVPLLEDIDLAVDAFRGFDGIVIDLRGNGGGVAGMLSGVAGHFFEERTNIGTMTSRTSTLRIDANPRIVSRAGKRVRTFSGPLAILTDGGSGSASEIFAGGMQDAGRARVFGETSAGAVLPALWDPLPNGDVLYHAIADYRTPSGAMLEGVGVVPDVPLTPTIDELTAGDDPVLEAALSWIADTREKPSVKAESEEYRP